MTSPFFLLIFAKIILKEKPYEVAICEYLLTIVKLKLIINTAKKTKNINILIFDKLGLNTINTPQKPIKIATQLM